MESSTPAFYSTEIKKKKNESHGRHFVTFDNRKLYSFSIDLINLVS